MSFQPNPNDELTITGETYRVAEHPAAGALTPPPAPLSWVGF
ncbi:MAG: hypothetical protein ACUVWZ_16790 [Anaerolineae bacterium]